MAHINALKKLTLIAITACVLTGLSTTVIAKTSTLGEKVENSLETLKKARQYSFDNAAIGILIAYGTGNKEGVTPQVIGDQFINELKKRGYKARYFYYEADWRGMSMEYYIGHSALGPWSVNEAAANIGEAIKMLEAARKVHEGWQPNSDQR